MGFFFDLKFVPFFHEFFGTPIFLGQQFGSNVRQSLWRLCERERLECFFTSCAIRNCFTPLHRFLHRSTSGSAQTHAHSVPCAAKSYRDCH